MKYRLLFALATAFFLCACGSSVPYTLANTPKNPEPLDPSVPVVVVNGSSVPVLPFEYKYLGTIETEAAVGCSTDGTVEQLRKMARDVGANVVYVKKIDQDIAIVYTGVVMMSSRCLTLLADFIYAEAPLITKWQEEEKKAMAAKEAKE